MFGPVADIIAINNEDDGTCSYKVIFTKMDENGEYISYTIDY